MRQQGCRLQFLGLSACFIAVFPGDALARRCFARPEKLIVACTSESCGQAFEVREQLTGKGCEAAPVVAEGPSNADQVVSFWIEQKGTQRAPGVFELTMLPGCQNFVRPDMGLTPEERGHEEYQLLRERCFSSLTIEHLPAPDLHVARTSWQARQRQAWRIVTLEKWMGVFLIACAMMLIFWCPFALCRRAAPRWGPLLGHLIFLSALVGWLMATPLLDTYEEWDRVCAVGLIVLAVLIVFEAGYLMTTAISGRRRGGRLIDERQRRVQR